MKPPTCHDANHEASAVMPEFPGLIDVDGTVCAQNGELRPSEVQSPSLLTALCDPNSFPDLSNFFYYLV